MCEALLEVEELDEKSLSEFIQVFRAPQEIEKQLFIQIYSHFAQIPNFAEIFFAY